MIIEQRVVVLAPRPRGFHLVTDEVERALPELSRFRVGIAQLLLLHTSASISLNENADPDVRRDMAAVLDGLVREGEPFYRHTLEGLDDMPAHVKASLFGASLTIPVRDGAFLLGTWQGLWLGEHRDRGGSRSLAVTIMGE